MSRYVNPADTRKELRFRRGSSIPQRAAGPLDMATRGKELTLCEPHSTDEGQKQEQPSPGVVFQDVDSQKASTDHDEKGVEQLQASHGLKAGQGFETLWNRQPQSDNK